jgi:hypothetical protein
MKIKETEKGNIQITMNKQQAASLNCMLSNMDTVDYRKYAGDVDNMLNLWVLLKENQHLL